jgi:hypothetical protein
MHSLLYQTSSLTITFTLTVLMVLFYGAGHRLRNNRLKKNPLLGDEGLGPIEGSLLGLLALLLSFSFSMSSSRHDARVQVMVQEANAIGTAILRADLFPDSIRQLYRTQFKDYVEARIALYNAGTDPEKNKIAAQQSDEIAARLWKMATAGAQSADVVDRTRASLMIPALNDMIDAVTTRRASREETIPESILWLLFILCLAASFIVGYGSERKTDWVMVAGFSLMVAIAVFSILDLDRPHRGLITLDTAEQHIVELRNLF